MKKFDLEAPLIVATGETWQWSDTGKTDDAGNLIGLRPATLLDLTKTLVGRVPLESLTMADAISGKRVIEACASANGTLDLEDADYDWLKVVVETHAPHIYGINAAVLKEALGSSESRQVRRAKARK